MGHDVLVSGPSLRVLPARPPAGHRERLVLLLAAGLILGAGLTTLLDRDPPLVAAPDASAVAAAWVEAVDGPIPADRAAQSALAARIGRLYAPDATAYNVATETNSYGRFSIISTWERLLALDHVALRVDGVEIGHSGFTVRWQRRAAESFFGACPFSTTGVTVFRVRDGAIVASYDYFDPREVLCGPPRTAPGA